MKNNEVEKTFKNLISKSLLEIPDRNFEEKIMDKVAFMQYLKQKRSRNLKLSWIFLAISALLFPIGYISIFKYFNKEFITKIGANFQNPESIFLPAMILIFAIIILIQIDNLLRLTFRKSLV
jgi:hypothetical protein